MPSYNDPYRRAQQEQAAAEKRIAQQQSDQQQVMEDAAKDAFKAEQTARETGFRAQGATTYTTADGVIHRDPLFEQKQAEKASKEQAKAAKAAQEQQAAKLSDQFTVEGRKNFKSKVTGLPTALESDEMLAARKKSEQAARIDKARKARHSKELETLKAEVALRQATRPPLSRDRATGRPELELDEKNGLPSILGQAHSALQDRLSKQAAEKSGTDDWTPWNESPTPAAKEAADRLARLQTPADLTDDDLALLDSDVATKPIREKIQVLRAQIAADDEDKAFYDAKHVQIQALTLKSVAPEKYAVWQRQRRSQMTPEQLHADLEASSADIEARSQELQTAAAPIQQRRALTQQKLDTLSQQAAERRQLGLLASEIVTFTRPDGSTEDWPADLAAAYEREIALNQEAETQEAATLEQIQALQDDLQAESALHAEGSSLLNQVNEVTQVKKAADFSNRLRLTPGMELVAGELDALQSEAELRAQDLADMHPDGVPEEAQKALQDDIQQRQQASLAKGQQRQQAAAAAYQGLQTALKPDKNGDTKADIEVRPTVIANLAEALQVEPQEAERLLVTMETLNWDNPSPQDAKAKTPEEFAARAKAIRDSNNLTGFASAIAQTAKDIWNDKPLDPSQTRLLPNGAVVVHPQITAEKDYTAAVNASTASPEAKAEALSRFPEIRHNAGAQVRQSFQELEGVYGKEWIKDWLDYDAKRPQDVTPEEWAMRFTEDRKNDSALRRVAQEIGWSFYKGGNQLRQQVSGLAGGITGSETAMQDALWAGRKAQAMQTSKELYGSASDNWLRAGLLEMTPEVATSIIPAAGGAKLAQFGIRGLAATGVGARLFPALAAVLEGSSTAAQAVKATQTLTRAGLAGASLAGGAQTYGAQISDIYGNLRRQGIEHADALRMAQTPAILSAGVTAALTALGGASGVERLLVNPASAKALFAKQFETQMKRLGFVGQKFVEGGLREFALEELPDEIFSAYMSGAASHPDDPNAGRKSLAEFLKTLPEFAIATGILGGAGQAVPAYQESSVLPAMHLRPETTATAWSAIDNHRAFTPDGVEDPNITAMEQNRASLALHLAQGGELFDVSEELLNAAGWTRDGTKFKPLKDYAGPQMLDIDTGGLPVIKDAYVKALSEHPTLAPVAKAIGMTETETRNFYASRDTDTDTPQPTTTPAGQAPAAATGPNANQSPVQTPAGQGTQPAPGGNPAPQSGTPVASPSPSLPISESSTPTTPADFLTNHFTERGLPRDQAAAAAAEIVARPEFAGKTYEEIITSNIPFASALADLGITGSLNSRDVAENPLKAKPGSKLDTIRNLRAQQAEEAKRKAEAASQSSPSGQSPASQKPSSQNSAKPTTIPKPTRGSVSHDQLIDLAESLGVDMSAMTREEYIAFAVAHGHTPGQTVRTNRQLRMARILDGKGDTPWRKAKAALKPEQSATQSWQRWMYSLISGRGTTTQGVRNRASNKGDGSSSWWHWQINKDSTAALSQNTPKSYITLTESASKAMTPTRFIAFLAALQAAGYNGNIKTATGLEEFSELADQIVMHGNTKQDADLAAAVASQFFKSDVAEVTQGVDRYGTSHSEAALIEEQIKNYGEATLTPKTEDKKPILAAASRGEVHIQGDKIIGVKNPETAQWTGIPIGAAAISQSPSLPVSKSPGLPPSLQKALDDAIPGTPSQAVFAAVKQAVQAKEITEQQAAEIVAQQFGAQDHTSLRQALELKLGWNPTRANTAAALHFGDKSKSDIPLAAESRTSKRLPISKSPSLQVSKSGPDQSWQDPASPLRKHRAWTTEKLRVLSSLRRPAAPAKGASASAQKKYQKALRAFESKQAWTREVFRLLENDIAKHHAFIEAIALGKTARQHLDGNSAAITVIGGKVTLAIDADALIANISDLESPQDRIAATFNEEYIHVAQKKLEALDPKNYGREALIKKWDALPDALRKAVWTSYRNANQRAKSAKDARLPASLSAGQKYHLMQEFNRMLVQDKDFAGKITETVDPASGLLEWVKTMLQKLGDILREMITRLPKAQQAEIQEHVRRVSELYQQLASASQGTSADRLGSIPTVTDHQAVATQALDHFMSAKEGIFQPAALAKIWDLLDPSLQRLVFRSKDRDPVTGRFGQQIASRAPKHDLMRDLLAMTATDPKMALAVQEALLKPGTQATKSLNLLDRLFTAFSKQTAQEPAPALASSNRITPAQDAEYMAAVKSGDVARQQAMVDAAAKAAGYDVKAYAGHRSGITTYDPSQKTPFFSKSKAVAESYVDEYSSESDGAEGRGEMDVYNVYLKLGKSLVVDFQGETWQSHPESGDDTDQIAYQAERDGYDSVTFLNIVDDAKSASSRAMPPTDEYAIFKPDAIKSADPVTRDAEGNVIPLSQRFNPESDSILFASPRSKSPSLQVPARNASRSDAGSSPSSPLLTALSTQSPDARRALATLHSQTLGVLADLIGVRFVIQLPQSPAIQAMLEAEPPQPEDEQKAGGGDQPAQARLRGRRWLLGQMRLKAPGTPPNLPVPASNASRSDAGWSQSPSLPPPAPGVARQTANRQYVADLLALIQQQEAADLLDTSFTERRAALDAEDAADHGEASTNIAGAKLRAKLRLQQLASVRARFFRQDNAVRELHLAEQAGRQDVEKAAAMAALATGRIGQRRNGAAWRTIGFTERRQLALLGIGVDQSSSGDQGGYPYTLSRRGMAEARVEFSLEGTPERQIAEEELDWMKEQEADYQTAPDDTTPAYVQNSRENWTRSLSTQGTDHILLKQEALDDLALSYPHTAALIRPEHAARAGFGIPSAQTRRPITQASAPAAPSPSLPVSESPTFTPLAENQSPFAQGTADTPVRSGSPSLPVSPSPSLAFPIPLSKRGQVRRSQFPDADSLAAFQFKLDADTVASARSTPAEIKKAEQRGLALLARLMDETGLSRSDLEKKLLDYHTTVVTQAEAASAFGTFAPPSFASVGGQTSASAESMLPAPVGGDIISGLKGQGIRRLGPPDSSDGWAWYRALERDATLSKLKPGEAQRRARKGDIADPKAKLAWLQENLVSLTSGRSIDEAATELSESEEQQFAVASGEELGQAILTALDARLAAKAAPTLADQEQTREKEALGSAQDFATYAAGTPGQPFTADQLAQELEPEDEIQIGSEYLTVLEADKDTGTLTLDSSRFGSVTVSGDQPLNLASGPNHLRISPVPARLATRSVAGGSTSSPTLAAARAELIAAVEEDPSLGASQRQPLITAQNAWALMLAPSAKAGIATDYIDGLKVSLANANTLANDRAVSPAVRQKAKQDAEQLRTLIPQEEAAWQRIRQQHTPQQLKQIHDDATSYNVPVSELQSDLDSLLSDFPDATKRPSWATAQIESLQSEIANTPALSASKRLSDRLTPAIRINGVLYTNGDTHWDIMESYVWRNKIPAWQRDETEDRQIARDWIEKNWKNFHPTVEEGFAEEGKFLTRDAAFKKLVRSPEGAALKQYVRDSGAEDRTWLDSGDLDYLAGISPSQSLPISNSFPTLAASNRWTSQKLREEVLRLNLPESRMRERRGARAWLTPSATWINVLDHGDVFPADMPGGDGSGMSWYGQMHAAGFIRVADIPRAAGPGGRGGSTTERLLVAEYHTRQLTPAQRRELENTSIERGAELFLDPQTLAASNRTRLAAASYVEEAIKDHSFRTLADLLRFAATDLPAQVFAKLRTPHLYNAWNTIQVENNRPEATRPEEAAALRALEPQVERRFGEMPPDIAAKQASITPESIGLEFWPKAPVQPAPLPNTDLGLDVETLPEDPEKGIQNKGSTAQQREQAIDEVYGPLAPGVEVMDTTNQHGEVLPHIMRGRGVMLSIDGRPHVAIRSAALPSIGTGHAPGVRFLPLAGDKSNWTGHINKALQIADPQLDEHTDVYIEPYGGGLVYLQNLDPLLKTSKPVLIASSQEFEPDRNLIYTAIKNGDTAAIEDMRLSLADMNHIPSTPAGESLCDLLFGGLHNRALSAAANQAKDQFPKLVELLQRPNVKILPWNDVQTFETAVKMARAGRRVTLLEDSNYADLPGEGTEDQYASLASAGPMLPGMDDGGITEFIGKDPAKLLGQKLPVYRAVLDAGGTIVATNNMNPALLGGLLAEFGDAGHWFGYAHPTRVVPDGWMRHPDGKGVLWSNQRPEYLAILRKGVVNPPQGAPHYGTDTPTGLDYRPGTRRSAEDLDRAAQPRRTPSPHTGGSLEAAESLRQPARPAAAGRPARQGDRGNTQPSTPVLDATMAGGPDWDATTSAKVAQELDQNRGTDPLDESPEVEALDYEAQLQEDADRFGSPPLNEDNDVNDVTPLSASSRSPSPSLPLSSSPRLQIEPGFYSALAEAIRAKMPARSTPATILGILKNAGLKAEELKWTGIVPWLQAQAQNGPITQQQVLDYLATEGSVKFTITRLGEPHITANDEERYSELVRIPDPTPEQEAERITIFHRRNNARKSTTEARNTQWTLPGGTNPKEVVVTWNQPVNAVNPVNQVTSPNSDSDTTHYGDLDALAWYRTTDRTTAAGTLLLVEEFQSKWAELWKAAFDKFIKENYPTKKRADLTQEEKTKATNHANAMVPDAPWVSNTAGWAVMLFKRALLDAVQSGKQWIGWTNGDTQADRYDLSKRVSVIQTVRRDDTANIVVKDLNGRIILDEHAVPIAKVPDLVGKDIARQIAEQPDGNLKEYRGDNLRVGGQGMRKFYDDILVKEFGKYVKQLGGGTVEAAEVNSSTTLYPPTFDTITASDWETFAGAEAFANGDRPLFAQTNINVDGQPESVLVIIDANGLQMVSSEGDTNWMAPNDVFPGQNSSGWWRSAASAQSAVEIAWKVETSKFWRNLQPIVGEGVATPRQGTTPIHLIRITPEMRSAVEAGQALFASERQRFPLDRALQLPTPGASASFFRPNADPGTKNQAPGQGLAALLSPSPVPARLATRSVAGGSSPLAKAYQAAMQGQSSQWLPIKTVWEHFHAQNPDITPAAFMRSVKEGDDAGTLYLSPPESAATVEAAGPFKLRNASGIMSTDMALATAQRLPLEPHLDLRYVTPDGQDPETRAETRRSSNPLADHLRDGFGTSGGNERRLPTEASQHLDWAQAQGWLIDTADLDQRLGLMQEIPSGDEHDVWHDELTNRAVKLTRLLLGKPAFISGGSSAYITNLQQQNDLFGTGVTFEGIVEDEGQPRIVTSMPWVYGKPATQQAKEKYFKDRGFEPAGDDTFYSMGRDLLVSDARAANIVERPDGTIQPIDIQIRSVSPRQAEMWENRVNARAHNQALAASNRTVEEPGSTKASPEDIRAYQRYWLNKEGIAYPVRDHLEGAQQAKASSSDFDSRRAWGYEDMWERGWARIATEPGEIFVHSGDGRQPNSRQMRWLNDARIYLSTKTGNDVRLTTAKGGNMLNASARVAQAAAQTNTNPTGPQKDAENYKTGKVDLHGLRLSIENPAGSVRSGTDATGKPWSITMPHHYGRILGTVGRDKDHLDFFLGPNPDSQLVLIVNQRKTGNGHFDEHKVMLGFNTPAEAARGYMQSYTKGWQGLQSAVPTTIPVFKHWLTTHDTTQPVTKEQLAKLAKTVPLPTSAHDKPAVSMDTQKPKPAHPPVTHTLPDGYHLTGPGLHTILPASIRAHHGTPHEIDPKTGFSLNKVGTGEGAQVYGWGLYFAEAMNVAEQYRKALSYPIFRIGDKEFFKREGPEAFKKWAIGQIGQEWPREVVRYFEHAVDQFYHDSTGYGYSFEAASQRAKSSVRSRLEQNKVEEYRIQEVIDAMGRITDNAIDTTPYDSLEGRWTARAVGWKPSEESFSIDSQAYNDIWSRIGWYAATFADAPARLKAEYEAQLDVQSQEYDSLIDAGTPTTDPRVKEASQRVRLAQAALDLLNSGKVVPEANKRRGNLYTVDILGDPAEFLDWDRPMSDQSEHVRKALRELPDIAPLVDSISRTGEEIYRALAQPSLTTSNLNQDPRKLASELLNMVGIKGVRYLDGGSRASGKGTYNYVLFDDKLVKIVEQNGKPVSPTPSLAASNRLGTAITQSASAVATGTERTLQVANTLTDALGIQQPLATFGSNNLDKKIAAQLDKLAGPKVRSAKTAVETWLDKPEGLAPTIKGLIDQILPTALLPREFLALHHEMQRKSAHGQETANDLIRALSGNPRLSDLAYPKEFAENPAARAQLFDAMEGRIPMATLPPAMQRLGQRLRDLLRQTGSELVRQGLMNPDTFEELQSNGWMPRYTEDEARESAGSFLAAFKLGVRDLLQQRSTAYHIVDTTRKDKTGQFVTVSRDEGGKRNRWRFRDAASRDAFYHDFVRKQTLDMLQDRSDKTVADMLAPLSRGDKTAMRDQIKSLTVDQIANTAKLSPMLAGIVKQAKKHQYDRFAPKDPFEPAKLIKDPVYAVARYVLGQTHNAATMELLRKTAQHPEWVSDVSLTGFEAIPDASRFGPLAGKHVRKDIAQQILDLVDVPNAALQFYDAILRKWKAGKLVWNPGSHIRDAVGNTMFAFLGGSSIWNPGNWPYYQQAIAALRTGGADFAELIEQQVIGGDAYTGLVKERLKGLLPDPKTVENYDPGFVQRLLFGFGATLHGSHEFLSSIRRLPDDLFKSAAYFKAKQDAVAAGVSLPSQEAAAHVRKWFPYYDRLGQSGTTRAVGRFVNPFFSFFRESTRILGTAVAERPLALTAALAFPAIVTAASAIMLGLDDDDLDEIQKDMAGKGKLFATGTSLFSMLLPFRSAQGAVQQFDISAIMPFADLLGTRVVVTDADEDPWNRFWRGIVSGGPVLSLIDAWRHNEDAFTRRPIAEYGMTPLEKITAYTKHAAGVALPPLAPGGTAFNTLMRAGDRSTNKTLEKYDPTQAVIRSVAGLNVKNATPDLYRQAHDFVIEQGGEVAEGMDYGSTTPASRARKALYAQLVQDKPNLTAIKNILNSLDKMGHPVRTEQDINRMLFYRNPLMVVGAIKQKGISAAEAQARFRASLTGESRAALENTLQEFRRIQAKAPLLIRQAASL